MSFGIRDLRDRAGEVAGTAPLTDTFPSSECVASDSYAIIDCNDIIDCMASITIRNLEEGTKRKLKVRAALNGRSMEQEAREILKKALTQTPQKPKSGADLVKRIRAIWEPLGGVELELPAREPMRDPEWLKDWK